MAEELKESQLLEPNLPSTSIQGFDATNKFKTYRKLPGAVDFGKEFEQTMCGFYALNLATNDEVKHFEMTSNNSADGKFDDIGLEVLFTSGKSRRFLFQLKHKENKSLNFADLVSESKNSDFGVKKYIESITQMNADEDTVFILYTNCSTKMKGKMPLTDAINFEQCNRIEFEDLLVNTTKGCENAIFETKSESLKQKFYFFTSQLKAKTIEEQVNGKLKSLLQCEIHGAFTSFIRSWWSGNFVLTRHDLIAKLSELALSPYLKTLTDEKCNQKTHSLTQIIMDFPLTIVEDCEEDTVENIWEIEESWTAAEFGKARNKYGLAEQQKNTILWYLGKVPLVVQIDRSNDGIVKCVMNILRRDTGDKKIILIGKVSKSDFGEWKILESLWDVVKNHEENHHHSDIMKTFYISFQERGSISLENLIKGDKDVAKLIGTRELLKMAKEESLLVGNQKEELPNLHIPRFISPILVKILDVLSTCRSSLDLLVIVNCDEIFESNLSKYRQVSTMELFQYISRSTGEERSNLLLSKKSRCTNLQFERVCEISRKSNVYLLQPLDDEHFIQLLKTGIDFKFETVDTEAIKESEILNYYDNSLHVFCAPPGMGKSTLMKILYNSCPSDCLAVYVSLINYNSFLATRPDFETILARFLGTEATENDLFQKLKKHFCRKEKLYLFLDGLDEVHSQHVEGILSFVKQVSSEGVKVWVSSRENLREKIRQILKVVPIDIKELGKEEQNAYICNSLKNSYTSEEIERIALAIFGSTDLNNSQNLLGIPLQLHIITEMFLNDRQVYENLEEKNLFVLTQMYKVFFEGKIKFAFNKLVDKNQQSQLGFVRYVLLAYEIFAVKACLSVEDYKKLKLKSSEDRDFLHELKTEGDKYGIVKTITENDEVIFSHQTYAEYFAASWFRKNTHKIASLQDRIFSSEYENLRLLFDIVLAEDDPLHLSIIYQDYDQFENHIEDVDCRDAGGRTAFHLAFSYGHKYDPVFRDERSDRLMRYEKKRETSCYVKMIEKLLQKDKLPEERDDLFGFDCVGYAIRSNCLYPIEKILEKKLLHFEKIQEEVYRYHEDAAVTNHSVQFGYPNLLSESIKIYQNSLKDLMELAIIGSLSDDTPTTEGNVEAARILIENGASLDHSLDTACMLKRFNMLEILIKNGAKSYDNDRNSSFRFLVSDCGEEYHQEIVGALKKFDFSVNAKNHKGATALHVAAGNSDSKIVEVLIENGADCNAVDYEGRNALHQASENCRPEVIKLFLDRGFTVNSQDKNGTTPLHLASQKGETEVVKMLLNHGADLELADNKKSKALHYASRSPEDNSGVILFLTGEGLGVNEQNEDGLTPLHFGCEKGHLRNFEILLEKGADPNLVDKKGENVLHHVIRSSSQTKDLIELLTRNGVDVNAGNLDGTTALHIAGEHKDLEIVEILDQNGADLNILDHNGRNVLHYASKNSKNYQKDVIEYFLNRGLSVNAQDTNGVAPLHLASQIGFIEVVKILLEQGADPKILDNEESNVLHYASKSRRRKNETIELWVHQGFDVNAKNKDGLAPIHFAWIAGNSNKRDFLLQNGAEEDVNAKNENGDSLLHLLCKCEESELRMELLNRGADPNYVDNYQRNALYYNLLESYDNDLVHQMIDRGLNLYTLYENGQTLLHVACLHGDTRNVRKLVEMGVDVNVLDENRQSPLQVVLKSIEKVKEFVTEDLTNILYFRATVHESETYKFGCERCYGELLKKFIQYRGDTNFVGFIKENLLETVGSNDRINLFLKHILKIRLDTDLRDTMRCIVVRFMIFEMIDYLLEKGSEVSNVDSFNKTVMDYALELEEQLPEILNRLRLQL